MYLVSHSWHVQTAVSSCAWGFKYSSSVPAHLLTGMWDAVKGHDIRTLWNEEIRLQIVVVYGGISFMTQMKSKLFVL